MHVNDLNDDILSLICKFAVCKSNESIMEWRTTIPLLHINRRWRVVAGPYVNREVLIATLKSNYDVRKYKLVSNLLFVTAGYNHKCMRSLNIQAHVVTDDIMLFCKRLYMLLSRYKDKLSAIKSINIQTVYLEQVENKNNSFTRSVVISQLGGLFECTMPNVNTLVFGEIETCALLERVHTTLVETYKHQLVKLETGKDFTLPQTYSLKRLACLNLSMNNLADASNMFGVVADLLVRLTLNNIPRRFQWTCFKNEDNNGQQQNNVISFSGLKCLNVGFDPYDNSEPAELAVSGGLTLRFPMLEKLGLSYYHGARRNFFVRNAVFPQHLDRVTISVKTGNLGFLAQSRTPDLPQPNILQLNVDYFSSMEEAEATSMEFEVGNAINVFLGRYHGKRKTVLRGVNDNEFHPNRNVARVANLSTILLRRCKHISAVIEIMETVPGLEHLEVLADFEAEQSVPSSLPLLLDNCMLQRPEPFNTGLKSLDMHFIYSDRQTQKNQLAILHYLMLRIPMLEKMYIPFELAEETSGFIQKYRVACPHLENIQVVRKSWLEF